MARLETDREDLMREASALRRRVELALPDRAEPVVAGFRDGESVSLYFGGDLALHFDAEHRLRRAFLDGDLYRTQGQTLARLVRVRTESETILQRHDLSPEEMHAFFERIGGPLTILETALQMENAIVVSQIPPDDDLRPHLLAALRLVNHPQLRLAPAIKR